MATDPLLDNFGWLKRIAERYGPAHTADLIDLADRLVDRGLFPNRRAAVAGIEANMAARGVEVL